MKSLTGIGNKALRNLIVILLISIGSYSCTKTVDEPDTPGAQEVFIQDMAFSPSTITVNAGTTVTWTNKDINAHTVTSNTGAFDSGTINPNETFSFKFNTPGSFPYRCTLHSDMKATVVVN